MGILDKKFQKILQRVKNRSCQGSKRRTASDSSSGTENNERKTDEKNLTNKRNNERGDRSACNIVARLDKSTNILVSLKSIYFKLTYFHVICVGVICEFWKSVTPKIANIDKIRPLNSKSLCEPEFIKNKEFFQSSQMIISANRTQKIRNYAGKNYHEANSRNKGTVELELEETDCFSDQTPSVKYKQKSIELDISVDECATDSSGRESGYLSDYFGKYYLSLNNSPNLSPQEISVLQPYHRQCRPGPWYVFEGENECKKCLSCYQIPRFHTKSYFEDIEADIPDYDISALLISRNILQTKYVTTIFELSNGGILELVNDLINELNLWFNEEINLIGIACELHWSVPEKFRQRSAEKRMKDALHLSLRKNNLRVLNLKSKIDLPLTLISAVTEENCLRNKDLGSFQGIYRRFYSSLLPFQHPETGICHKDYWNLSKTSKAQRDLPVPNVEQFRFGSNPVKLEAGSLIALNIIALRISIL